MPTKDQIKVVLKELSAEQGGSLVKEIVKSKMKPEPLLFISLGGLGGQTLQCLKGLISKEYEENHHVAFIAVDTSQVDLSNLDGLTLQEKFSLYDPTCVTLPSHLPSYVKSWINPEFPKDDLKSTGAEGTRQVARLMLCGTNKYESLRTKIIAAINEIRRNIDPTFDWIRVNLIAGISGGTGSGTVIDVAYMVHDIMHDLGIVQYDLRGFFYLPDAQKNVNAIRTNPSTWKNLQRNGYAALKEIDYFMTNGTPIGNVPVYSLDTQTRTVNSTERIFDVGDCILVSSLTTAGSISDITELISRFASFIAYIFTDMHGDGANARPGENQDILSTLCNLARANLPAWKNHNINGVLTDNPNWAGYHYSAIGYSSMYIPRDEIMAYCANLVFVKMYESWNDISFLNQQCVDNALAIKKLDSLDNVFRYIRDIVVNKELKIKFRIDSNDPAYPVMPALGLGGLKNTESTIAEAEERARQVGKSLSSKARIDSIVDDTVNDIFDMVKMYFDAQGPFFAIAMLSGLKESGIKGFLQRIDDFKKDIDQKTKALKDKQKAAQNAMEEEENSRRRDIHPTAEETDNFIDLCEKYTRSCVDVYIILKMKDILDGVYKKLNERNTETYEIYTTTIEVLSEMLRKDSIFATDTTRIQNGKGETFYFDAIGFKQSEAMRRKFLDLFEDVVDDKHAEILATEFKNNMFGEKTRDLWKNLGENKEEFVSNIRKLFQDFFKDYTDSTLEKFLVISNSNQTGLTPQRLTQIWDATQADNPQDYDLRKNLIDDAANNIYNQLSGNSSILMRSSISQPHVNSFLSNSLICLIDSMHYINEAMRRLHTEATYVEVDRDFKSSITMYEMRSGIPAATICNMRAYAQEYYISSNTSATRIGRHMDEGDQKWDYYLPEIYGYDADAFYSEGKEVEEPLRFDEPKDYSDFMILSRIRDCFNAGLSEGWIAGDDSNGQGIQHYNIYTVKKVYDEYASFKQMLIEKLRDGSFISIWDIAKQRDSNVVVEETEIVPANSNDNDLDILTLPINNHQICDIHRVIRKNIQLMRTLFEAHDNYRSANSIISVYEEQRDKVYADGQEQERLKSIIDDVRVFTELICYDLIAFDSDKLVWKYRQKEDKDFEPLVALNRGIAFDRNEAKYYLAFVEGYIKNKDLFEEIVAHYRDSTPRAPRFVYDDVIEFMNSDYMTNFVTNERNRVLEEEIALSPYKDSYSYPYFLNGEDSTYKNLHIFYSRFKDILRNYLLDEDI